MNAQTIQMLTTAVIALAAVLWIGARQLQWRPLTPRNAWTMPIIVSAAGVLFTINGVKPSQLTPTSLGLVLLEAAVSIGIGAAMGALAVFRPVENPVADRRGDRAVWETRTGWLGLVLWIALIGLRVGVDAWAGAAGLGTLVTSTGAILLVIGLNRLTRSAVLQVRLGRSEFARAA